MRMGWGVAVAAVWREEAGDATWLGPAIGTQAATVTSASRVTARATIVFISWLHSCNVRAAPMIRGVSAGPDRDLWQTNGDDLGDQPCVEKCNIDHRAVES